jgi:hypothetical protein
MAWTILWRIVAVQFTYNVAFLACRTASPIMM